MHGPLWLLETYFILQFIQYVIYQEHRTIIFGICNGPLINCALESLESVFDPAVEYKALFLSYPR
jgi:hypothetical protein